MDTNGTQVKISLPGSCYDYASRKAGQLGIILSSYIKKLILNDVKNMDYPVYQASKMAEESYQKAVQEKNESTDVKHINAFFDAL